MAVYDAIENADGGLGKAIDDVLTYSFDFSRFLATGQTVSGATIIITPAGGPTVGTVTVSGSVAQAQLTGGAAGTYTVQCTATLSTGETKVVNGTLVVSDDDA